MTFVPGSFRYGDTRRAIHDSVFVARTASVVGNVTVGEHSSVWFGAVLRGDMETIRVGEYTNIQDNAVIHVDFGFPTIIGSHVSIGHSAIVHGATVGENCIIGMHSTVLNGAVIGENCIIAAGALILEGQTIPPNSVVTGAPGKIKKPADDRTLMMIRRNWEVYADYARHYRTTEWHQTLR